MEEEPKRLFQKSSNEIFIVAHTVSVGVPVSLISKFK